MISVDKEALKDKYAGERAKRLRSDGNDQYVQIEGTFDRYLDDPYLPVVLRDAKPLGATAYFQYLDGWRSGELAGLELRGKPAADAPPKSASG